MSAPDLDTSLPDWLIDVPESQRVFERHQMDASCCGKSLEYCCRERGLDPQRILRELMDAVRNAPGNPPQAPLT